MFGQAFPCAFSLLSELLMWVWSKRFPRKFVEKFSPPAPPLLPKKKLMCSVSITASNSSNSLGKLNLSMPICHKLFSFCYRKAWRIVDIRKNFTQFLVAPSLKGLWDFYLSVYFVLLFFLENLKVEEGGNKMQYLVSMFEKKRLKGT